jgi:hypothetical protein
MCRLLCYMDDHSLAIMLQTDVYVLHSGLDKNPPLLHLLHQGLHVSLVTEAACVHQRLCALPPGYHVEPPTRSVS